MYVSDKPGSHDFDLLRKLVLSDGSVLRADLPGRPTRDCLFHDPTREDVLLKIFNRNGAAGVIGVFNARYDKNKDLPPISGHVSPADVLGLRGDRFAMYAHSSAELRTLTRSDVWELSLPPLTAEVFTIVPIGDHGIAPIGLTDKFNSAGAVTLHGPRDGGYEITLRGEGPFAAWCASEPSRVQMNGETLPFSYDAATHLLLITTSRAGIVRIDGLS
ncbi:MAG: Sip1-related alpha-galactosidase [Janthinobacterium lividum]